MKTQIQPHSLSKLLNETDEMLMSLYQSGDFNAFQTLYERHSGRVYEYLRTRIPEQEAQELVQEIFEKLHKARVKYNSQYPFLPWLFTIARNTLYDYFKLAETKLSKAQLPSSSLVLEGLPEQGVLPSVISAQGFSDILKLLPDPQRRAIELRYLHEWTFEKIAEEMKTSEENVRQIISRSIRKLKDSFKKQGGPDEQ